MVKGFIYNQENPYLGLENGRWYWGEAVRGEQYLGKGTVYWGTSIGEGDCIMGDQ